LLSAAREQNPELTESQIDEIVDWLGSKWGAEGHPCPYCENSSWEIGTQLVELHPVQPDRTYGTRGIFPHVQLICTNCGNTVLLSAEKLGLLGEG
jgi:hypothetical protein